MPPSPWLDPKNEPKPDPKGSFVSFVEYLRWMRPYDSDDTYKDATKVQILQMAQEKAKTYRDRLTQLSKRTQLIAGEENTFKVKCPWRIRVGGHRGPESILLPAFDALGIPYIPSSTLRGVARCQGIREFMMNNQGVDWKEAEKRVAPYFGSIETKNEHERSGKVIFFDAYPLPPLPNQAEFVAVDMVNNIWNWSDNDQLDYKPNPNPFLSLKEPKFLIGLRLASGCNDSQILEKVKQWLVAGLQEGIGSQVNTGYGEMRLIDQESCYRGFFQIEFNLKGQLIHGRQKFQSVFKPYLTDRKGNLKPDIIADAEVRPVAFKSMLRYWFRTFARGVLPAREVQQWEATLFGSLKLKHQGWVRVGILEGKVTQKEPQLNYEGKNKPSGQAKGILTLAYSSEIPEDKQTSVAQLFKNLTWLMFHLGGIGQGARRPCYSRQSAPWYRGSSLTPNRNDIFWQLPSTLEEFKAIFQQRLEDLYKALASITTKKINYRSPKLDPVEPVSSHQWAEAVDNTFQIVVVCGNNSDTKSYALDILHEYFHHLETSNYTFAKSLCGGKDKDNYTINNQTFTRGTTPSPVWVADFERYQVVTVFGATHNPRQEYLNRLRTGTSSQNYLPLWPLPKNTGES
ncbi:type III-B CRISPR module RAMP protein Cmr6 [Lyngbya aestuarii]|uniref:type III-B CRISPR module RAMP protein Cmr6 n=1 Tax=Lyngbya aestuarii TaxID=118322 RepID=UPI00403E30B1